MRRIRFNIASLLGVISVIGVGFAALRESSDLWVSSLFTLTLAALLISILLAIHRTEKRRAFWLGFALFGSTAPASEQTDLRERHDFRSVDVKPIVVCESDKFRERRVNV
jgi:uncharacterized membrane protein